jgi:hypothetical protein
MYDVFLISYDEPHADRAFNRLKAIAPLAKRVHGVKGIQAAHQRCAEMSRTAHFFVVDADNEIHTERVLEYRVPEYDASYVHLWYARNPLNGLAYGWGGLKLFPRALFENVAPMGLDMTTAFPLKIMPEVVSLARFNSSPFETWRSAFRECVKLTLAEHDLETAERLQVWLTEADGRHADQCLSGAQAGHAYAKEHRDDVPALLQINDYDWLASYFGSL